MRESVGQWQTVRALHRESSLILCSGVKPVPLKGNLI